jgi:predicted permease
VQPLQLAVRHLRRAPGFTAVATLTLALGIATLTTFAALEAAWQFRPASAIRLDRTQVAVFRDRRSGQVHGLTLDELRAIEAAPPLGARAGAIVDTFIAIAGVPGSFERVSAQSLEGDFASTIDLRAIGGRMLGPDDDRIGAQAVAVISERLWRQWFAASPEAFVHGAITINGQKFALVGAAPRGFNGLAFSTAEIWIAQRHHADVLPGTPLPQIPVQTTLVRAAPGADASLADGLARVLASMPAPATPAPDAPHLPFDQFDRSQQQLSLERADADYRLGRRGTATQAVFLLALAALTLVLACANVANMFHARALSRRGEVAVRLSLGATARDLFALVAAEAVVIGSLASIVGFGLATAVLRVIALASTETSSRMAPLPPDALRPDTLTFLAAFGAGLVAAISIGAVSTWRADRLSLSTLLAAGAPTATHKGRRTRLALVVVQVACAVVLVMGSGVIHADTTNRVKVRDDRHDEVRIRYDAALLSTTGLDLGLQSYSPAHIRVFADRLVSALSARPDIEHAALASGLPGGRGAWLTRLVAEPPAHATGAGREFNAETFAVTPGFLSTLGLHLRDGRDFQPNDRDGGPRVAIVSASVAAHLFPNGSALGQPVRFGQRATTYSDGLWRTVVGVVDDPIRSPVDIPSIEGARIVLEPFDQHPAQPMQVLTRSRSASSAIAPVQRAIHVVDPDVATFDAGPALTSELTWVRSDSEIRLLMGSLAGLALLIASLGIYGVMAYLVGARTREIGVRLALGASRGQITRLVVDEAIHVVLLGLLPGVFIVAVAERLLEAQILSLMPNDISTWVIVPLLILGTGVLAAYAPARRASRVDPNAALRSL